MTGRHIVIFFLLSGLLLQAGCSEEPRPLLRIDNRAIFLPEFRRELQPLRNELSLLPPEEQKLLLRQALSQLIDRQLLQVEAERQGISVSEAELQNALSALRGTYSQKEYSDMLVQAGQNPEQWHAKLRSRLLNDKVAARISRDKTRVSDKEIEAYYLAHLEDYRHPEQLQARQILLNNEEEARELWNRLLAGENFATLAAKHSLSPDREAGGDLGIFARGQLPKEFDQVLFELTPGRVSEPVKSPFGVHLFLVEKHIKAGVTPRENVVEEIRNTLQKKKETAAYQQWLQTLREETHIIINWEQLDKIDLDRAE